MSAPPTAFVTAIHPCAEPARVAAAKQVAEERGALLILFGDVTGPVMDDRERLLYLQAESLLSEEGSLPERIRTARALLAGGGLAEEFREALSFYFAKIADLARDEVAWQEAFRRSVVRLQGFLEAMSGPRRAVLADTLVAHQVLHGEALDYREEKVAGKTIKAIGLSPADGIVVPSKYVPDEYRQDLPVSHPIGEYLAEMDILVANALAPGVQEALRKAPGRLAILPGSAPEVSPFGESAVAFESPGTFSLWEPLSGRWTRTVHRSRGGKPIPVRIDLLDERFRLVSSEPCAPPADALGEAAEELPAAAPADADGRALLLLWPRQDLFVEVIALFCEAKGIRFARAAGGAEAITRMNEIEPRAVVLRTTNLSGEDASASLRSDDGAPVTFLRVYPAMVSTLPAFDSAALGPDAFVEPFPVYDLLVRIEAALPAKAAAS